MAELTHAQLDVAAAFFALPQSDGFVIVGGAALLALELIDRPTEDLDFFTDDPTRIASAVEALVEVGTRNGWGVVVIRSTPTFHRLEMDCDGDVVRVDVAVDSPPRRATIDVGVGPTLDPLELAGRKLLALFDRAAPRDFADVYRLTARFGRRAVVEMAFEIDPGFDVDYLAVALDRAQVLGDDDFPIAPTDIPALRSWATDWARAIST